MYFPFFELHGWGKRFAVQPQAIYSEVPKEKYPEILKGISGKYMNLATVDPEKWISESYAIVKIDSRGCRRSEGIIDNWTIQEAKDYAECIEKIETFSFI